MQVAVRWVCLQGVENQSVCREWLNIVGSLVPVTVSAKKAPEKPREKVKKWRFVFQKCRLQKAICFGAALFSALHEVT